MTALVTYSAPQLALIRNTVAKGTTEDEFNWFIEVARSMNLNPLRRQIYCFIFHAKDPKKRNVAFVTGIDGYRAIAARSNNYRPGKAETVFDEQLVNDATNPLGIAYADVTVHQYMHGEWHAITERAYWDEFAPIVDEWAEDETGQRRPTGKRMLDKSKGMWRKIGRVMIEKCAEARALRRGWPETATTYIAEELDRAEVLDITPAAAADSAEQAKRLERIGGHALIVDWLDGKELQRVPVGKFGDVALSFVREQIKAGELSTIGLWRDRNRHTLTEYWAHDKDGALVLKQELERVNELAAAE